MNKRFLVFLFTNLISLQVLSSTTCEQTPLLIENVKIYGEAKFTHILIDKGRIKEIGHNARQGYSNKELRRLDAQGAYALPGLIDSHTHLDALPASKGLQKTLDVHTDIFPMTMRQTLASGVTTTRVHLAAFEDMELMKSLSDDDCFPSPRIVLSGPGLVAGAPAANSRLMKGFKDSAALRSAIQKRKKKGAEWVALHRLDQYTPGDVAILQEYTANGQVKFMADTDRFEDFAASLEMPIASAEYINRSQLSHYPEQSIKQLKERQEPFYVSAPLGYYARSAEYDSNSSQKLDQINFLFTPADIVESMESSFKTDFEADQYIAKAVQSFGKMQAKFGQLRNAGAQFVVGSDTGSLGQFHNDAVWRELATLNDFGLTPSEAIEAATLAPARMLGKTDIGRLSPGAYGDLVLYTGDLSSGEFSRVKLSAVIKGGNVFVNNGHWVGATSSETQAMIKGHLSRLAGSN